MEIFRMMFEKLFNKMFDYPEFKPIPWASSYKPNTLWLKVFDDEKLLIVLTRLKHLPASSFTVFELEFLMGFPDKLYNATVQEHDITQLKKLAQRLL